MQADEYLKLAEVEDRMWYFRALHRHVRRELEKALGKNGDEAIPPRSREDAARSTGSESRAAAPRLPHEANRGPPHVLDAGCGTGGLILRLRAARPEWEYSGIDFMPLACELARRRAGPKIDIREASITALPFADGSFDAVVSADVICQVDDAAMAVGEFFRVLRPGGVVVINVPAYMWMWSYHDDSCQTKHRYTRREVAALLAGAGFHGAQVTHWNALPFPLVWAKRKLFRTAGDTSDVKLYPAPLEAAFSGAMALEQAWLEAGGRWAWGTSVFAVARKP